MEKKGIGRAALTGRAAHKGGRRSSILSASEIIVMAFRINDYPLAPWYPVRR